MYFGVVWMAIGASDLSFTRPTVFVSSVLASMVPWSSAPALSEFSLMSGASVEKPSSVLRPQTRRIELSVVMQSAAVSGAPVFGFGSATVPFGPVRTRSFGNGMT